MRASTNTKNFLTCSLRVLVHASLKAFRAEERAQRLAEILTADAVQHEVDAEIGGEEDVRVVL